MPSAGRLGRARIVEFEMDVRYAGDRRVLTTFVAGDR
jgi:hypothetical protein